MERKNATESPVLEKSSALRSYSFSSIGRKMPLLQQMSAGIVNLFVKKNFDRVPTYMHTNEYLAHSYFSLLL